uniref:Uncharacterized protein n=1 Tax=Dictyoglomus turgidum TaxID=513050 RepID=A0A7C3WMN5_9BACT
MLQLRRTVYDHEQLLTILSSIISLAGAKIKWLKVENKDIEIEFEEEVELGLQQDLMSQLVTRKIIPVEKFDEEVEFDYFLRIYKECLKENFPKMLLLSPDSVMYEIISDYIYKTPIGSYIFGMLIVEESSLDKYSFVVCGSSGFGEDIASIQVGYKGAL